MIKFVLKVLAVVIVGTALWKGVTFNSTHYQFFINEKGIILQQHKVLKHTTSEQTEDRIEPNPYVRDI